MKDILKDILNGGIAGSVAIVVSNPFDKIKTQIQKEGFDKNIIKNINIKTFNAGLLPAICGMALEKAAVFSIYNLTLKNVKSYNMHYLQENFIAGGAAGLATSFLITPFEQIKVQYQTKSYQTILYSQTIENKISYFPTNTIISNIKYYYRGLGPVLTRETPGFAVYFPVFEFFKKYFNEQNNWNIYTTFFSGAMAGIISWIPIYPQDTIKTIIQSNNTTNNIKMIDCINTLFFNKNGIIKNIRNIYRGFWLVPLRVVPLHGTVLTVMELLKN